MSISIPADLSGLGLFTGIQRIIRDAFAAHDCNLLEGSHPVLCASVIHGNREAIKDARLTDCVQDIPADTPWIVELAFPGADVLACFAAASYQELAETLKEQLEPSLLQPIFAER